MKLVNIHTFKGLIRLQSGLHIGAGNDVVEIGGMDQPVIRDPLTGAPYIPGSSIKGKMRYLLESAVFASRFPEVGKAIAAGKPCGCGRKNCPDCALFGAHNPPDKWEAGLGPSRILARDAMLSEEFARLFASGNLPMEVKYENTINRVKGIAEHPRQLERVPAGTEFSFNLAVKVYEGDREELLNYVLMGLRLIELDALGGCSSRGCGQVVFRDLALDGKPCQLDDVRIFAH